MEISGIKPVRLSNIGIGMRCSFYCVYSFKKLLRKLTQECVFSINSRLIKQVVGCPMGWPISVVFSDFIYTKWKKI